MKIDRYFAVAAAGRDRDALHVLAERARRQLKFRSGFASDSLVVLVGPTAVSSTLGERGIAVGRVFPRISSIGSAGAAATAPASAAKLFDDCWGDYVAFFNDVERTSIVRSPSGGVHAYRGRCGDLTVFASDVAILLDLDLVPARINWDFVAEHLAFPHLAGAATGIAGIDELFPGEQVTVQAGESRCAHWSPWRHVAAGGSEDYGEVCETLHRTVRTCVATLADRYDHILLELSGGLDSSIVAAGLQDRSSVVHALNLVTPTAEGDERRHARRVASHLGFALGEAPPRDEVDLTAALEARWPRPGLPGVLRAWEPGLIDAALDTGAEAFFSGTGGDNVFCSLGSAAPAADVLQATGVGPRFIRTINHVAMVHDSNLWTVAAMSFRQARRARAVPRWPRTSDFLVAAALPDDPPFHPWLVEPDHVLPGKRSHVRSIIAASAHLDGYSRHRVAPSVFPLLSQPVVELCLSIPTWTWVAGGRDRAVARDAFRNDLPAGIVDRRTKGMMNAYCGRVFQRNRSRLSPFLLDGHLAEAGLIDRNRLATYLDRVGPVGDIAFYRVLTLADVEVWLRSWLGDP